MKIKYKEDPRVWRKSTLLTVLGLALVSSLLRWRRAFGSDVWLGALGVLSCVAAAACIRPGAFRSYYRFSTWAGFWSSQAVARVVLTLMFFLIFLPAGLMMRLIGKDPLHLKRAAGTTSYWVPARSSSPLDRLF